VVVVVVVVVVAVAVVVVVVYYLSFLTSYFYSGFSLEDSHYH